ncbi:MAG TPA: LpqB family beta-propeller domain-containing protein [Pyrinomonadaceae bacterium]|nr:LpqB family beta-propeller domain-containing protein [Pyrinomonadaceae bacterium]
MSTLSLTKQITGLSLSLAILMNCFITTAYPAVSRFPARANFLAAGATLTLAPANDNFADAQNISGDTGSVSVDNTDATAETGEPDHAGHAAGLSVWYRWQPTTSGNVTFDTLDPAGVYIDTVLSVYTGSSVSALTEVASNDDASSYIYSAVSFEATASTVYYIALDVHDQMGFPGAIVLNWQPASSSPSSPTSAADGKVAFGSVRGLTMQIFVMNDDGSGQTRLTDKTHDAFAPVWSPDGTKIAFVDYRHGAGEVYVMNADGSNQTRLTNSDGSRYPSWSPDSTKIALTTYDSSFNSDVYVVNADGTGMTNLTQDPTETSWLPRWSPDGTKILFISSRDGLPSIYVMDSDGTDTTRLTYSPDDAPVWSPDGSKIAFVRWGESGTEIYVMDADGSDQTNLTNTGGVLPAAPYHFEPSWSPDGTRLVFTTHADYQSHIYRIDVDGTDLTQLTDTTDSMEPRWSPDGTRIAFITYRNDNQDIYLMDADGDNEVNLTANANYNGSYSWQPVALAP